MATRTRSTVSKKVAPVKTSTTVMSTKTPKLFVCPICTESIKDASEKNQGQDSIECEGDCASGYTDSVWACPRKHLKRPVSLVYLLSAPCRLLKQEHEICELRSAVSKLQSEVMLILQQLPSAKTYATALSRDESSASIVSQASDHSSSNKPILLQTQPMQMTSQVMPQTARLPPRADRKFNLVIHGIKESTKGTSRHIRSSQDIQAATSLLSSVTL